MEKEYKVEAIDLYQETVNDKGEVVYEPTGEIREVVITILIAEEGRHFIDESGCKLGNRIEIGTEDSEENYTEVSDGS